MAREKKDFENFAIRKVEFARGWQGKSRIRKILPSENETCELDGKKPGETRKMLPSENEVCELDGKGKVGFGKFCHQKSRVCDWMAREKKDSENFAIRK